MCSGVLVCSGISTNPRISYISYISPYLEFQISLSKFKNSLLCLIILTIWKRKSGSGTPRTKTISARDSSAQIDFFTGTPRPGTPRPCYKNALFVAYNGKQMYIKCFFFNFNIRFSAMDKRDVKKRKAYFHTNNVIFISCGTLRPGTLRSIFTTIDFSSS